MLGSVLPGLRELRAPLAAGYLWLLFAWLVWGDELPAKTAKKADPLDRLYQLEPVVTSIGLAVVASVAAYVVGSIVIDLQTAIGRRFRDLIAWGLIRRRTEDPDLVRRARTARLSLTDAGGSMLQRWESARAHELRDEFRDQKRVVDEEAQKWSARPASQRRTATSYLATVLDFAPPDWGIRRATREHIAANRDLLKTRLLDVSGPLHSDLDRPDAEATFRMAVWPPLAAIVIYLTLEVSWWWAFALVVPVLLAWQWISLRRKANDALVAAFVARDELGGETAQAEVRKDTVRLIIQDLTEIYEDDPDFRPPPYLREYLAKPTPAAPTSPQPRVELWIPESARASDGRPTQSDETSQSDEPRETEPQPGGPEPPTEPPPE